MGKCPICKKTYPQGTEYCPHCCVGIVFEENEGKRTFVEVYRTEDPALAGLIKEVLEDHGLICYLENYSLARIYPSLVSPIRVMVYKEGIEEANEILRLFFKEG
ncbi:MAG TPA: DUF2007 domain-containing protein [Thermodesulfobacteriota bacterium]|nr:DUF2007 domain-containing protein [Thermodesulfobacteriota bacterium]